MIEVLRVKKNTHLTIVDFFFTSFQSALYDAEAFEFGQKFAKGILNKPIFSTSAIKGI